MTEKRFYLLNYNNHPIYDSLLDEEYNAQFKKQREKICDLLNKLHEENIRLKRDFNSCSHNWALMYDEAKEKVEALTKENSELEQENEKLENRLWNYQNVR